MFVHVWSLCLMAYQPLFNAKAILLEEQKWYYLTHKGAHTFPKGICLKVNVIARLEYELAYYDFAVHRFNHYTTRTPLLFMFLSLFYIHTIICIHVYLCICEYVIVYVCVYAYLYVYMHLSKICI